MSIKNINEIQSNDYRTYDQEFLKETLSALANSGQRYGQEGQGFIPSYFGVYDIFKEASVIKDDAYSYVECDVNVAITDTKQYTSIYGQESSYNKKRSYLQYSNVVKDGDVWSKTPIATSYFDDLASARVTGADGTTYTCYADMLVDAANGVSNTESTAFLYTITNAFASYDGNNYNAKASFDLCKGDYNGNANYIFNDVLVQTLDTSDSTLYNFYLCQYNVTTIGGEDVSSYNIYYIDKGTSAITSQDATLTPNSDLLDPHSKAVSSYGYGAINYLYYSGKAGSLYNGFTHQKESETNFNIILNEKGTTDFIKVNIQVDEDGKERIIRGTDKEYTLLTSALQYILKNSVPAYEKELKKSCLENEKQNFIDALNWSVGSDYVNEYLDVNGANLSQSDYITVSTYFNPNFKFDVYVNSLDNSHIYSSSNDIQGEYCTNNDVSKAIDSKVVNASDNTARTESFVADWTGIQSEEYDADYKKFEVYDRNVLYKLYVDNDDAALYNVSVISKYILPFINKDNYWCINGNVTPVRALGYDTNASLIILYSDGTDNTDSIAVLSTAHKTDIKAHLKTETIDVKVGTASSPTAVITPIIDIESMSEVEVMAETLKFVKSSVVMSISKVTEEQHSAIKGGYITTYWVYVEKDDAGNVVNEFRVIKGEDGNVLDMSNLSGVAGIIEANKSDVKIEPDKYAHDQLYISVNPQKTKQQEYTMNPILGVFRNFCSYTLAYDTVEQSAAKYSAYGLLPLPTGSVNDTTFVVGVYDENVNKNSSKEVTSEIKFNGAYVGLNVTNQNSDNTDVLNVLTGNLYKYGDGLDKDGEQIYDKTLDYFPIADKKQTIQPSVLDTSAVLINHANAINRFNIFSFADSTNSVNPNLYYSYIGTRFDGEDKTHLTIGTASETVDLSEHILPSSYMKKMAKQSSIDIDFNDIYLNGNVRSKGLNWFDTNTTYNGYKVYSTQIGISNIGVGDSSIAIRWIEDIYTDLHYLPNTLIRQEVARICLPSYINRFIVNNNMFYIYYDEFGHPTDENFFPLYMKEGVSKIVEPYQVFSIFAYFNTDNSKYTILDAKSIAMCDSAFNVV